MTEKPFLYTPLKRDEGQLTLFDLFSDVVYDMCGGCGKMKIVWWRPEAGQFLCDHCANALLPIVPPKSEKPVCPFCGFDVEDEVAFDELHRIAHKKCVENATVEKWEAESL